MTECCSADVEMLCRQAVVTVTGLQCCLHGTVIARGHSTVHLMKVDQCWACSKLWTKETDVNCKSACGQPLLASMIAIFYSVTKLIVILPPHKGQLVIYPVWFTFPKRVTYSSNSYAWHIVISLVKTSQSANPDCPNRLWYIARFCPSWVLVSATVNRIHLNL